MAPQVQPWIIRHTVEKRQKVLTLPSRSSDTYEYVCVCVCLRDRQTDRQAASLSSLDALCHVLNAERCQQRPFPVSQGALTISLRIRSFSIRSVSFFCSLSVLACQVATALDSFWIFPATDRWYSLKSFACCKILFRYSYRVHRREKGMFWSTLQGRFCTTEDAAACTDIIEVCNLWMMGAFPGASAAQGMGYGLVWLEA